ncbi:hypothetical protein [Luteibacter aegosomatissinici]|uniref:hypothetical protein n=1 Tax=Luteibacter aegosomatissinici TaxID=2911539 RepID=UPI001FF9C17B|nr:hypothetical protein [Luteibacter aegosomatissinici]UPG93892.1 hypothetical protein L2Y97_18960 [Luteibacter aegosomatissinici]
MDNAAVGFLLGVVPGMAFAVRNMLNHVRVVTRARQVVREHGERFEHIDDLSAFNGFAFKSSEYVKPTDGPGVREAKEMLLARRDKFIYNHLKAFFFIVVGAMGGAFLGAVSKLLIGG